MSKNPWDERYQTGGFYYGTEPNDFLKDQFRAIPPGGRVLCLAEGEGRNAVFLAKQGYRVTAVDGSAVGLAKLSEFAKIEGVEVQCIHADLNEFKILPQSWEGVVSVWCHLPSVLRKKVHSQVIDGLVPKGVLILESYRPKQLEYKTGGPPSADMMMTLADLKEELRALDLKIAQEIEREISEGKGHQGRSAVVQVLAAKPSLG